MARICICYLLCVINLPIFSQGVREIDLGKLRKPERDPFLSEIAKDIKFIKLETQPECLIGSVSSVSKLGENYLLSSEAGKTLFVFSSNGKFIRSIGRPGKGPGEFSEIYGLSIDSLTNHIYILDNGLVKLIEYTQDGVFVKENKLGFYATGVKVTESGFIFYTSSPYSYRSGNHLITITDKECKVIQRFHAYPGDRSAPDRVRTLYSYSDEFIYWEPYWDTVYSFNGERIKPKYIFNLGEDALPKDLLRQPIKMSQEFGKYLWLIGFREYRNFIYFEISDLNRRGKRLFYDKRTGSGYCIPGNLKYINWGFIDDLSGGPLFHLDNKISMSEVACIFEVIDLKQYQSSGLIEKRRAKEIGKYQELIDVIKNSSIEDNPIIAIAQLK